MLLSGWMSLVEWMSLAGWLSLPGWGLVGLPGRAAWSCCAMSRGNLWLYAPTRCRYGTVSGSGIRRFDVWPPRSENIL